jgi:hypothetical protein
MQGCRLMWYRTWHEPGVRQARVPLGVGHSTDRLPRRPRGFPRSSPLRLVLLLAGCGLPAGGCASLGPQRMAPPSAGLVMLRGGDVGLGWASHKVTGVWPISWPGPLPGQCAYGMVGVLRVLHHDGR